MAAPDTGPDTSGYHLLDTGHGAKLEQVGPYRLVRPAPQALWRPTYPSEVWETAVACYRRHSSGAGAWTCKQQLPPAWTVTYGDLTLKVKLTDFGHLGFFAEHEAHWQWVRQRIHTAGRPIRLLNAFAYTGGMSLAAALAGASVVHLDAAEGIVAWARDNAQLSGLAAELDGVLAEVLRLQSLKPEQAGTGVTPVVRILHDQAEQLTQYEKEVMQLAV